MSTTFEAQIEQQLLEQEASQPWMNGFDTMFDAVYFQTLGNGIRRRDTLFNLGVLSNQPDFGNPVPSKSLLAIKAREGYIGGRDAIKFALGARAAFKALRESGDV